MEYSKLPSPNDPDFFSKIVSELKARNTKALALLIDVEAGRIGACILTKLGSYGSSEDAEELTQNVFYYVWKHINKYDDERGTFRTWLTLIAEREAKDLRRKRERRKNILDENIIELDSILNGEQSENIELYLLVETLLSELSPRDKKVVAMRYGKGLTFSKIAQSTGLGESTVKRIIANSLERMKTHLEILEIKSKSSSQQW